MTEPRVPWLDQELAARVRAHIPEESPIDLDEHAARIGSVVAAAELSRIAESLPIEEET